MVVGGGGGGGWIKPLQTLSQGLVLTLRSLLALSLTILNNGFHELSDQTSLLLGKVFDKIEELKGQDS